MPPLYAAETLEPRLLLAVLYVDLNAPGLLHDGTSWDSAYVDLQPALAQAQAGDQIRIAGGTYKPTANADRTKSFQLKSGVALYGGYGGHNATNPDQRDVRFFPTFLSGEIGDPAKTSDNSYHVVYAKDVDATAILDGLTITAGNANRTGDSSGGGMYNDAASPTLTNCTFVGNSAVGGGGMRNASSSPRLTNCCFVGNSAYDGGGMSNFFSSPTLTNCTFVGNSADRYGGGMYDYNSCLPKLINCILWGNNSGIYNDDSKSIPTVTYCDIQGGHTGTGNLDADPQFIRSPWAGPDGVFATADDDYGDLRLRAGSPALNIGSNAAIPAEFTTDLAGNARIQDGTVDLGAYEGAITVPAPKTVYVDQNATGVNTGTSWSDAYTSLQSALIASANGDTIRIADGTYTPTETADRTIGFVLRNAVALYGGYAGFGAPDPDARDIALYPTILSGDIGTPGDNNDNSYRVVRGIGVGSSTVLDGIAITLGNARDTDRQYWIGGGLYLQASSPTLTNCIFAANSAPGGGVFNSYSSPTLTNCRFVGNSANYGGGMRNDYSTPTLTNCSFVENSASIGGGGMYNYYSSATLTGCTFIRNSAESGGGMSNNHSTPTLTNCGFAGNSAIDVYGGDGGGMSNFSSSPTLTNCSFAGNSASDGGGMFNDYSSPTLTNCSFVGNSDINGYGGGLYNSSASSPTLTNCILWSNGSDIYNYDSKSKPAVTYCDTQGDYSGVGNRCADPQFVRNPSPGSDGKWGTADDDYGNLRPQRTSPAVNAGSNNALPTGLATDLAGNPRIRDGVVDMGAYEATESLAVVAFAAATQQVSEDAGILTVTLNLAQPIDLPVSVSLTLSGTATLDSDYRLLSPNPIVFEPGSSSASFHIEILEDIRYELGETLTLHLSNLTNARYGAITTHTVAINDNDEPPVLYVDSTAKGKNNGSSWADAYTSLQAALKAVQVGAVVCVAAGTYTPGTRRTDAFFLQSHVAIYGGFPEGGGTWQQRNPAAHPTILSGEIGDSATRADNSYHVVTASRADATAVLDGLTITAGCASGSYGGGMYNSSASPTLVNCTFISNSAQYGGGICNTDNSSPTLTGCTFTRNSAGYDGGGMYNYSKSSPTLTNCSFFGNSAVEGGGMYTEYLCSPTLTDCIFGGNSAIYPGGVAAGATGGGGMYSAGSTTLTNCTFSENVADEGGGIFGVCSTLTNCILWGNTARWSSVVRAQFDAVATVSYSLIQGGWTGTGNLNADPQFVRAPDPGPDGKWGTADDDYGDLRLRSTSPALNAGSNAALPAGLTIDLAGNPRLHDDTVDLGVYEATDWPALVTFATSVQQAAENAGIIPVTLNLSQPLDKPVSISLLLSGTATLGSDYRLLSPNPIVFEPGSTSVSFNIEILEDTRYELGETLTLRLGEVTGAWYGGIATHILTIEDNDEPPVLYVDSTAKGSSNGSSWADAYPSLQTALQAVEVGAVICVAAGTYTPGSLRTDTFQLRSHMAIYGGFPEGGGTWQQRNPSANPTILSGEIGDLTKTSDNSYHVITAKGVDATAILDGLTITAGNAGSNGYGAGMYNLNSSSPTVRNCIFTRNSGGGVYNYDKSSPTLINCAFIGNSGSGMYNSSASPTLINCTLSGNSGSGIGNSSSSSPTLVNCILWGNTGQPIVAPANVSYSLIQGGSTGTGNLDADPQFVRSPWPGPDGVFGTADDDLGDLRLRSTSPALNAGSNDAIPLGIAMDLAGNPRLIGTNIDLGAYETPDLAATVAFAASAQQVSEDVGTVSITLALSQPLDKPVSVSLLFWGKAILGSDYRLLSPNPIVFEPGSTAVSFDIEILNDTRYELSETLLVYLGNVTNAWYGDRTTHTITLLDDNDQPPVIYVDDTATGANNGSSWADAYTSLQAAIQAVEVGAVLWVAAGTYTPGMSRWNSFVLRNRVAIYGGFPDGGGSWEQRDPAAYPTILSGEIGDPTKTSDNCCHVVYAKDVDSTAILNGLTITGGCANGSSNDSYGSGIYIASSSLTLANCTFTANSAYGGGGMYIASSLPTLINCSFSRNSAHNGGGIYIAASSPTLTQCSFVENSATGDDGCGAGIYNRSSSPMLTQCSFSRNSARVGGGMYNTASSPTLTNCSFAENLASGGGMYNVSSSPALINCSFSGNSAGVYGSGAGMSNVSSSPTLADCSFSANSAYSGGGMYNTDSSSPTLTNCSFAGNVATGDDGNGGGMYNDYCSPTLTNCIVWGNSSAIYSRASTATVTYSDIQGGYSGTGNLDADPQFVRSPWTGPDGVFGTADDDYGDLRLRAGSPALNAGSNAALPTALTTDLAGNSRIQSGTVDLGVYEGAVAAPAPQTIFVDQNATGANTGTSWADAYTSLQSALIASVEGDTICIADGTYKPAATTDRTIGFTLKNAVAIYGGFAGVGASNPDARDIALYPTILSGDVGKPGDQSDNSYHVVTGLGVGRSTILDGLTITLGNANGSQSRQSMGGGLYLNNSSPTLTQCSLVGNSASSDGGGMCNFNSSPMLANCTFAGNSATGGDGGGMYNESSSTTVTDCRFVRNSASYGGGVSNSNWSSPILTNCSFLGNMASSEGGAMDIGSYGSSRLTDCSFVGNTGRDGSAIRITSSWAVLTNCTFSENSTSSYGSIYSFWGSSLSLTNCIAWGNAAGQLSGSSSVTYSDIQGGYSGTGNLNADPQFIRNPSPGIDGKWGTPDDDYGDLRLRPTSPALNAGSNAALPSGLTTDLAGHPRLLGASVDMGAYETPDVPVTVAFATSTQQVSENAGTVSLILTLSQPLPTLLTVPLLLSGNAIPGTDYRLLDPNPVVFEPGSASTSFRIEILDDNCYELSETLTVRLGQMTNIWYGPIVTHTITIIDDEEPPVLYVDDTAKGANNGSSWADAYTSLQTAIQSVELGATIWVAAGTYTPGMQRTDSFQLRNHVAIYGGFPEGGGTWEQRDPVAHPTILSGEIGDPTTTSDNSYHVVYAKDVDATAVLDGLTITAGNANGSYEAGGDRSPDRAGGGLYNNGACPTLANCIFSGNAAASYGGGMFNTSSSPAVMNCTFYGNSAGNGGGLFNRDKSSPALTNCTFTENSAGSYGGGMYNEASAILGDCIFSGNRATNGGGMYNYNTSSITLTGCSFTGNSASYGGGMYNSIASSILGNCTFSENSASGKGGGMYNTRSSPALTNCTFSGDSASSGGGMCNESSSPTLSDCIFRDDSARDYGGGVYNYSESSPILTHCLFSGNSAVFGGGLCNGYTSSPTLTGCTFTGNSASSLGGGIYNTSSSPTFIGCVFNGNSASYGGGMCIASSSVSDLRDCTFSGNSAKYEGGGIYNYSASILTDCTFIRNSADDGGGMYNAFARPILFDCTFGGNLATHCGGGMSNYHGASPALTNCTFSGNLASKGGGIFNYLSADAQLINCTLSRNSTGSSGDGICCSSASLHLTNSIVWEDIGEQIAVEQSCVVSVAYSLVRGGFVGTGNLDAEPQFVRNPHPGPDGKWGTTDDDYGDLRLRSTSPAANAGSNATIPLGVTTDLAGNPRLVGDRVDLGAYETPGLPTVSFAVAIQEVSEAAGTLTLTLNLSQPLDIPVSVSFLLGGTATLGSDYRLLSPNPLVFEPGSTSASFDIEILNDTRYELSETLRVQLDAVTNAWYGRYTAHEITVLDDSDPPPVLYVDDTATGANNGSSWADAYTSLQEALQAVQLGATICVAAGTYKPGAQRTDSFQLRNHVAICGGFPEGGGTWQQRNPAAHPTILSGEIGDPATTSDNSYHVVYAKDVDATSILDGLIITGGNANGDHFNDGDGGGMYNDCSSPTLVDCAFRGNSASFGGGVYNYRSASPSFTNCIFTGNSAICGGGLLNIVGSSPVLTNCTLSRNSAAHSGGAVCNSLPSYLKLANTILWGNTPDQIANEVGCITDISYSLIQDGWTGTGNLNTDPQFVRNPSPGSDGKWGTADDDYGDLRLRSTSPAINAGNNAALPSGLTTDLAGNPRLYDGTVDLGACEYQGDSLTLSGTPGPDTFYLRRSSSGSLEIYPVATPEGQPLQIIDSTHLSLTYLSLSGDDGNDCFILDFAQGNPLPGLGLDLSGGTGANRVILLGNSAAEHFTIIDTQVQYGTETISLDKMQQIEFDGQGGLDTLSVGGSAHVRLRASQHLASLTVGDSATVAFAAGGDKLLQLDDLSLGENATLDLADNALIRSATPETKQAAMAAISNAIRHACQAQNWSGTGLTSSVAQSNRLKGLAVLLNDRGNGRRIVSTFQGRAVGINDILVRYTWNGDVNLDGVIDAADYFRIDSGYITQRSGYQNGDLNFDGVVDTEDYRLVDDAFTAQTRIGAATETSATAEDAMKVASAAKLPQKPSVLQQLFSTQPVLQSA